MALSRKEVGLLAFIAGLFVAFFLALVQAPVDPSTQIIALGLLGISVGLLNIDVKEMELYLVGTVAVVYSASMFRTVLDVLPTVSGVLERLLGNVIYIITPAAALIALRIVYEASKHVTSLPAPLAPWKSAARKAKKSKKRRKR